MNINIDSVLQRVLRALRDECAQTLPLVALMITGLFGIGGLVVDAGSLYYSYNQLQAATDAAALAGAGNLPNSTAISAATTYSALAGDKNANSYLTNVSMVTGYPLLKCLTTLENEGVACVSPANANAIQVKEQALVPTYFARIFGIKSVRIATSTTAAMRGAITGPYNIVIVVDTTSSMNDTDSDSQCNTTRLACSLAGVQSFLQSIAPCESSESTCGTVTSGNVANSVDRVSLFTFPNVTVGTAADDYSCGSHTPTIDSTYTFPSATATTYAPSGSSTGTYLIVNYSSDYRTSDTATTLSSSSDIVEAVGGKSGCSGMTAPGGDGTYYAGVIYAAQASLVAEKAANSGSQNVLIIISDGDANATSSHMTGASTTSGTYPSTVDQCGQAVTAAKAAATAGTRVYTVAYGAESSGCTTDTTGFSKGYTPCETMENMASAPQYFFSDYAQSGSGSTCVSASQPTTNLDQIFADIATDFTVPRIIPDSVT